MNRWMVVQQFDFVFRRRVVVNVQVHVVHVNESRMHSKNDVLDVVESTRHLANCTNFIWHRRLASDDDSANRVLYLHIYSRIYFHMFTQICSNDDVDDEDRISDIKPYLH